MGILSAGGLIAAEGAARVSCILILNAVLVHVNCVTRWIECHTVEESMEGRRSVLRARDNKRCNANEKF